MKIKTLIESAFSFGAAVVILGAYGKILHKPFADALLTAGLITEACIFILYGILEFTKKPEIQPVATNAASQQTYPNSEDKELKETMKSIDESLKRIFKV